MTFRKGAAAAPALRTAEGAAPSAGQGDNRVPLTGMRRVIAERLLASKTQLPHLSVHRVDAVPSAASQGLNSANEGSRTSG
jgi:pyruvate dehydrogenase E2 component (dihydrolipoamide acetyltransferase)